MQKLFILLLFLSCNISTNSPSNVFYGNQQLEEYLPLLKGKRVGLVANHTSVIDTIPLAVVLLKNDISIRKIFALEHGYGGNFEAGEIIGSTFDSSTQIEIVSLYGKKKKPFPKDLEGIDVILFDIQDVGVRFFTYISSLKYLLEACAENDVEIIVLDRPNPNDYFIDGAVLEEEYASFVGAIHIPVVYALTIGELAKYINNEEIKKKSGKKATLTVIPMKNYVHGMRTKLPIPPSPNLPDEISILLYPTSCFFEGTIISEGRGTFHPFQNTGHPNLSQAYSHTFTPKPIKGMSLYPKHPLLPCYGLNLKDSLASFISKKQIRIEIITEMYEAVKKVMPKDTFFLPFFDKLAGTNSFRKAIEIQQNPKEIRAQWKEKLENFKKIRKKYLLYPDFKDE